jgi:quinoprotein glucose dehydrogenase
MKPFFFVFAATCAMALLPVSAAEAIPDSDWPGYANDPGSSKYADLRQINQDTIAKLQVAWVWDSADNDLIKQQPRNVPLGFKSTPIKIGNTLYLNTSLGQVAALDPATGKQRWLFDTQAYEHGRPANLGFNTRGVAYWSRGQSHRILVGTNNGFLWSLNADTGLPDKAFGAEGKIDLTQGLGRPTNRSFYSSVSPPLIVGDTVIMGSVVMDVPLAGFAPRNRSDIPPGHVRGFDVLTGAQTWIFHTIPQEGEPGIETWENESWRDTGATNVWTMMSADPELGYVYLPIGTPNNDWYGGQRLGDNLYGESLVCIKASTGERVWHFQGVHHGLWDYDFPAAPNLVNITVDGKAIKAVAQISKQGFVYVLDRVTGKPVWPIEERPVPQSDVPGERTSATQPIPTRPAPFDVQGIDENMLIDFTPELRAEALTLIKQYDYGPLFTPPSLKGAIQLPGDGGGGEWTGGAFDPETGMLYVTSMTRPIIVKLVELKGNDAYGYVRSGMSSLSGPKGLPIMKPPYGRISAIDLNTGDYAWVVPNGEGMRQRLIKQGIADPGPVGVMTFAFPLLTRSFLFVALSDGKNVLRALDKKTGVIVHEVELPSFPGGAPMTYVANGKQYIALTVGGATDAKLVALALP